MNVIELHGVSVCYRTEKIRSVKELVVRGLTRRHAPLFYSLRDVSLSIGSGESVGIIGANGAGKSTLLRVAAGIVSPSDGMAVGRGSIVPLLELGTGFEAELSGRENIHFNGALLGRSRAQMQSQMDAIVAFSGLEEFIDAPLRTYSTGMVARLAFSIAVNAGADIMFLDEIFAVGDMKFQEKCREQEAIANGRAARIFFQAESLLLLCPPQS